jgi:hypothetical protein
MDSALFAWNALSSLWFGKGGQEVDRDSVGVRRADTGIRADADQGTRIKLNRS